MSKQLLRHWVSKSLPELKQGSTIFIRSSLRQTNVSIRSQWRDDGHLSLLQTMKEGDVEEADVEISKEKDLSTSLGREESHISVHLTSRGSNLEVPSDPKSPRETASSSPLGEQVILDDGSIVPDSHEWLPPPSGFERVQLDDEITHVTRDTQEERTSLSLEVPEKVNIECDLTQGGSISMHSKVEGDIRLTTTNGDIQVKKLRGHSIDIRALGPNNNISSSNLLEAKNLSVFLPQQGRFRAKRIHASFFDVRIGEESSRNQSNPSTIKLFDEDDAGSICDISSLYVTGDASISVETPDNSRQSVRLKSHHGHVVVNASAPKPTAINEMTGKMLPVVDMGGVNGSFEVFAKSDASDEQIDDWVSCHVHIDSMSPDSVSLLQAYAGNVHVTLDRKVESDLRMVSSSNIDSVDMDSLLVDKDDKEYRELKKMLRQVDETTRLRQKPMIKIKTKAFTENEKDADLDLKKCEFVDGWVENKSEEPDSRFDRKLRGDSGSIGKIRLTGAADQALQGFHGSEEKDGKGSFPRPILAISSTGEIVIETLSWLGNIARRYGLDDHREKEDLGRTATRRGRSLDPSSE